MGWGPLRGVLLRSARFPVHNASWALLLCAKTRSARSPPPLLYAVGRKPSAGLRSPGPEAAARGATQLA